MDNGLSSVHPCSIPNGLIYAQELLKVGAMDVDNAVAWLQFNWQAYPYRLVHQLFVQVMNSDSSRRKRFKDVLPLVDEIYGVPADESTITSIEGKFSSVSSMMRRGFSTSKSDNDSTAFKGETTRS